MLKGGFPAVAETTRNHIFSKEISQVIQLWLWRQISIVKNITSPGAATALRPVWFWTAQSK